LLNIRLRRDVTTNVRARRRRSKLALPHRQTMIGSL
jgi:hypothetical protein